MFGADSDRPGLDPATARDLRMLGLIIAVGVVLFGMVAVLVVGLAAAALLAGAVWVLPELGQWMVIAAAILTHGGDPGGSVPAPWTVLAGRPVLYWWVTALVAVVALVVAVSGAVVAWQRWGPTPAGFATRTQIQGELSLAAARQTAAWTRPSMTASERRQAPMGEVAAPLHRGPIGPMCSPLENPTGAIAPTQSGKSRRDLVHKALDAPGALLCSTTKPDLLELAGLARTRRHMAGPVLVFDATATVAWPAQVCWSPVEGCTDLATAYRRAHTMVEAAAAGLSGENAGNDKVFRERATFVLAAYLLAAATHHRSMADIVAWAVSSPPDPEPVDLLGLTHPQLADNLSAEMGMVSETSDAVWLSVRRVVEPLLDPGLLALCTPDPGQGFDARWHIGQQGALFLIAGQHQARQVAPLLTALAEHWLTTAQEMALNYPARRLDPPATAVLDELPNATPLPELPDIVSDSAGRGVVIHWAAQSMAQLEDTFTPPRARQLLDNTTTLTVFGALKDARALEWASTLAGSHERLRYSRQLDGLFSPARASLSTETVPTLRPGAVRMLPRGRVLVVHRALPPILARLIDVSARPDWPALRRDVEAVRDGAVPVDARGYRIAPPLSHGSMP